MIKTLPAAVIAALFLASCAGYFDAENADRTGKTVQPLAIAGGGYLSSDTHNEITPFVFRDPYSGRNWIFYSSDIDGSYDIFYAELFSDGKFSNPIKMTNLLCSSSNEISPVLFYYYLSNPMITNLYISFIRISTTGSSTNIMTWCIDSYFNTTTNVSEDSFSNNAKHIGLLSNPSDNVFYGFLLISENTSNLITFSKGSMNSDTFMWGGMSYDTNVFKLSNLCYAANGFYEPVSENFYYIFQNSSSQLWGGSVTNFGNVTNFFSIPLYASSYHDRDPFIDYGDLFWPVYFSSDRYGRGNFDLYRYNSMTFKKVIP